MTVSNTTTPVMKQHLIDPEVCIRCNTCEEACPIDAISHDDNNYVVDPDICNYCMKCVPPCPTGAIDNWIQVLTKEAYSKEEQFSWDSLPEQKELPADLLRLSETGDAQANAGREPVPVDEDEDGLEGVPSTDSGASIPPPTASHAHVNMYTHKDVAVAKVAGNYRVTAEDTESDIHHVVLDFGELPFPVLEGQSIAIFPPGNDANGRPYHARQYSIASPRDGERPQYNNLSITVKRVVEDYDHKPVKGVCSNYLCDLKRGDTVRVIGPFGSTFLMPNLAEANLIMICTGTGSAPMRAMTERCRRLTKNREYNGNLMLFFGARTQRELPYFGPLMNLPKDFIDINLALSREPDQPKRYVQDRIRERGADIRKLLEDPDTYIYVCGLKGMEAGVLEALRDVVNDGGNAWTDIHTQLKSQGRLHFETY